MLPDAKALAMAELAVGDYSPIRYEYRQLIEGHITEYLYTENVSITKFRNSFKKAITQYFNRAFELGIADGGGEGRAKGEDLDWINAKVQAEWGFVDMLFQQLKQLKKEGKAAFQNEPARRAEGYARTLDGVYSEGKIRGGKDVMLTFGGQDGQESCKTCQKWKGKRHKASFWIARNLIPGQQGNGAFECGGWNCNHVLFDDKGKIFTI